MDRPEESIAASLGVLIQRSFRTRITEEIVAGLPEPISAATYPVISGVARLGPVRVAKLGEQIGLERSVIARRAALLIDAGLLNSTQDPSNPRATLLSLTTKGQGAVVVMRQRLTDGISKQLQAWPPAERVKFAELLARFVQTELGTNPVADSR